MRITRLSRTALYCYTVMTVGTPWSLLFMWAVMVVDGGLKKLEWHYLNCLLGVQSVLKRWLFSKVFFNYENFRIAVLKIIGVLTFPSLIFTKIDFYLQLQISFRISILAALNWFGSIWWSRGCPWLHNYWVLNNPKHNIWFFMPCFKVIRVNPFLTASHHHLKNESASTSG